MKWLRSTAQSYAIFIPGAKSYIDSAFNDLDAIQEEHGDEVNKIISQTYSELKDATKGGASLETAQKSWEILEKCFKQLGDLASDSASRILDNHPELKEKVGGNIDQLKNMANQYGPEAKEELNRTYSRIQDAIKGGVSAETISKVKSIIDEEVKRFNKMGDEAWEKGMEQAKPYFDRNPQAKEIVEKNAETLKQGNFSELLLKLKDSVSSGNIEDLEKYAKNSVEKAKQSGFGQSMEQYAKMIPGADKILPKLQQLQEVAGKHGAEAEKIVKGAYQDIQEVIQKRIGEAENLAEKAGKDAKS